MKRKITAILKTGFTILLILNTFIWLAYHGSGHIVPAKTNLIFGITSLIFLALLVLTIYLERKIKTKSIHKAFYMHRSLIIFYLSVATFCSAQSPVNIIGFDKNSKTKIEIKDSIFTVTWPASKTEHGKMVLNLQKDYPLFNSIQLSSNGVYKTIAAGIDPAFILTVGKRDLVSQNGWNIFFDKVPLKPHASYEVTIDKRKAVISSAGAQTIIRISSVHAAAFGGDIEITLYHETALFNVAAVMSTAVDSTAILYDAGLVSAGNPWKNIAWANTNDSLQSVPPNKADSPQNLKVKYRAVIGENDSGSLAVFPAPHQYFYPLDEAFNLNFTWYGNNYRQMMNGFGIGIRQEPEGDKRFVPWFNAPPGTRQRLNFFCLLNAGDASGVLAEVKKFTHDDSYVALRGYKTMASHFHNEFIMNVVLAGKPIPEQPAFVDVFKNTGIDIVHLGEFHYTAHPKGPDSVRLKELHALFQQCERLSDSSFLLLPGEEPNEFFGGHWLEFFPKPVYWIMSKKPGTVFITEDAEYGKVYHIGDSTEMLALLEKENGLAWTAHARTKGSTGFPDKYKDATFFRSPHFMGAAWKAMPADLSQPRLGKRVLDLLDDMNNWGLKKHVIAEADVFTIEKENEMYAHLNVNYLRLNKLPAYKDGWQPVLDAMRKGDFFTSTGEVLLPEFSVNGKQTYQTLKLPPTGDATVELRINWTFPLQFAEIISGDGEKIYRHKIDLNHTNAFGDKTFSFRVNLKNRRWVRVEVWDVAVNGAFTQTVFMED